MEWRRTDGAGGRGRHAGEQVGGMANGLADQHQQAVRQEDIQLSSNQKMTTPTQLRYTFNA